jgi:glycosyltransferase involved in cell wall biosynthesis
MTLKYPAVDNQPSVETIETVQPIEALQAGSDLEDSEEMGGVEPRSPFSVIIPAYNEEGAIKAQVEAIRQVLDATSYTYEIIVIDDGSTDATVAEALSSGVRVLQHAANRGYGASLKTGIVAATYDMIVIIDADGTYPCDQIPELVTQMQTADMVVGARVGQTVHIPLARRPAKFMLRWLATRISDQPIPDLNSGLRAFRRSCIRQYFPILSNRFSFTTTSTLSLLADDYRVVYHPINYYKRIGHSKITPRHFMEFAILILRMAMLFQPLKVFVPFAFFFGALGAAKVVYDLVTLFLRNPSPDVAIFFQPAISSSAVLLLLVGFQLLLVGMMADGLIRRIGQHNRSLVPSHGVWGYELTAPLEAKEIDAKELVKVKVGKRP